MKNRPPAPAPPPPQRLVMWITSVNCSRCYIRNLQLQTRQQHALHVFRVHGIKNSVRLMISRTTCYSCFRQFHTRERYLNHIRYASKSFYAAHCFVGNVLSVCEADDIDNNRKSLHRQQAALLNSHSKALESSFRLIGSLPFVRHSFKLMLMIIIPAYSPVRITEPLTSRPVGFPFVPTQSGGMPQVGICVPCVPGRFAVHRACIRILAKWKDHRMPKAGKTYWWWT